MTYCPSQGTSKWTKGCQVDRTPGSESQTGPLWGMAAEPGPGQHRGEAGLWVLGGGLWRPGSEPCLLGRVLRLVQAQDGNICPFPRMQVPWETDLGWPQVTPARLFSVRPCLAPNWPVRSPGPGRATSQACCPLPGLVPGGWGLPSGVRGPERPVRPLRLGQRCCEPRGRPSKHAPTAAGTGVGTGPQAPQDRPKASP